MYLCLYPAIIKFRLLSDTPAIICAKLTVILFDVYLYLLYVFIFILYTCTLTGHLAWHILIYLLLI